MGVEVKIEQLPYSTKLAFRAKKIALISEPAPSFLNFFLLIFIIFYFVGVYPGCKTLLPKIVACEGGLNDDRISQKKDLKKKKKRGGLLISLEHVR